MILIIKCSSDNFRVQLLNLMQILVEMAHECVQIVSDGVQLLGADGVEQFVLVALDFAGVF